MNIVHQKRIWYFFLEECKARNAQPWWRLVLLDVVEIENITMKIGRLSRTTVNE